MQGGKYSFIITLQLSGVSGNVLSTSTGNTTIVDGTSRHIIEKELIDYVVHQTRETSKMPLATDAYPVVLCFSLELD